MLQLLPGKVTVENDVVFGTTGSRDLKCDIYRPPIEGDRRPGCADYSRGCLADPGIGTS